jgi:hypothetical protein
MNRHVPLVEQLPNLSRKPYIRPDKQRDKIMTIAASFRCFDGVVMCADRLISHGRADQFPSFGHFETKIWHDSGTGVGTHYAALVAASGHFPTAKVVADGVIRAAQEIHINLPNQFPDARATLQAELDSAYARALPDEDVSLLVAIQESPVTFDVLRSDNLRVNAANDVELVGIGENSLARFLTDNLFNALLSLEEAAVLGALVIYQAKKYCSQYCGGRTDVWALNEIGEIQGLREDEINNLEILFAKESYNLVGILTKGKELLGRKF